MKELEKLYALLSDGTRTVKYGVHTGETADPLLCLQLGESAAVSVGHLGDGRVVSYPTVILSAYSADYLTALTSLESAKAAVKNAQKATVHAVFVGDLGSTYDAAAKLYQVKATFKIIQ